MAPALIRPGRVDVRVHFDLASKAQIRGMFWRFYKDLKAERDKAREKGKEIEIKGDLSLEEIADKVVDSIDERSVSTAQLQGLFIRFKTEPESLLESIFLFLIYLFYIVF